MKKVIITGATGAIGMALLNKCVEEHTKVLIICHRNSMRIKNLPKNKFISVIEANLAELSDINVPSYSYDVFYHLAWDGTYGESRNALQCQTDNIKYTLAAVELAVRAGCKRFIGIGSQAEYGRTNEILKPQTPTFPESGYGIAKLCAGQMSRVLCAQKGIEYIWVRVLSVYGPFDGAYTMINSTISRFLAGDKAEFTKGEQVWDYLYSSDAADALYALGKKGISNKIYVLGSGEARPLREYIEIMKKKSGYDGELEFGAIPYQANQVMRLQADISQLTEDVAFTPKVSFGEGIEKTIDWMRTQIDSKG